MRTNYSSNDRASGTSSDPSGRRLMLQVAVLLSLFTVLIVANYVATSAAINVQEIDSAVLNRAGAQRMLTEQFAGHIRHALVGMATGNRDDVRIGKRRAAETKAAFWAAHRAFLDGGDLPLTSGGTMVIPAIDDDRIRAGLDRVEHSWKQLQQSADDALREDRWLADDTFMNGFHRRVDDAVRNMNDVTNRIERRSARNFSRLHMLQRASVTTGILLFAGTLWFVWRRIVVPLDTSIRRRERLQREMVDVSRRAGMAEIAASVLHNVGNVLNSVNVSTSLLMERLGANRAEDLVRACALIDKHRDDAADFFMNDPRGRKLPDFLNRLGETMVRDNHEVLGELAGLEENVQRIKQVISMQQSFATPCSIREPVGLADLVDDAVKINDSSLTRHEVTVNREYDDVPQVVTDKHKVMQILLTLVKNAVQAVAASQRHGRQERWIRLRIRQTDSETVVVSVSDNGAGISPENMPKLFTHGFTTKKHGHGFGLHSGALAARELGGKLTAHSDGQRLGATFTLTLPLCKRAPAGFAKCG
jgi:signal transduction histidine kinase